MLWSQADLALSPSSATHYLGHLRKLPWSLRWSNKVHSSFVRRLENCLEGIYHSVWLTISGQEVSAAVLVIPTLSQRLDVALKGVSAPTACGEILQSSSRT